MKKISTEKQLYVELAQRGDPSAFYALFHDHIRNLYISLRERGKDHQAICGDAAQTVVGMYRKFVRQRPKNPQKWFAAGCKLKKFDAGTVRIDNGTETDINAYEKVITAALNKAYGERLEKGSDGKGNVKNKRPRFLYIIGLLAAVGLVVFLFLAETAFSVSFGRFGSEYRVSFPNIAERLWELSGLVRADEAGTDTKRTGGGADVGRGRAVEADTEREAGAEPADGP